MQVYLDWSAFKSNVKNKELLRFIEREFYYTIVYEQFDTSISKTDPASSDQTDFETNYKSLGNKSLTPQVAVTSEPLPFSVPSYRTKRSKNPAWVTCPSNTETIIDFQMTSELYASGGMFLYKDAKEGDYITAEVFDTNSVIPEAYRTALCEAWPCVAKYVIGAWLLPGSGYQSKEVNTYPLNAKISAGLYLRITYCASAEAGDRKAAVTYFLAKKL
jgi:hypothetical protein